MPSTDSARYSPYSTVHRSIDSMLSRLTHKHPSSRAAAAPPVVRRSVLVKLRQDHTSHRVAAQPTATPKKTSLRTVLRRIADGMAFGVGSDAAIDSKTKARQRAKRTRLRPLKQAVETSHCASISTTVDEEYYGVPVLTHESRVPLPHESSFYMPADSETGLEVPLAMFHISNTESASGGGEYTSYGAAASDTPVDMDPVYRDVATPVPVVDRDGLPQSFTDGQVFNNQVPVADISPVSRHQDSSLSSDTERRKPLAERMKSFRNKIPRPIDEDHIPEIIILSARPRAGSLAGQFWRRKANRSHRVDAFVSNDDATSGRPERPRTSPYTREKRPVRRGGFEYDNTTTAGATKSTFDLNAIPRSFHAPPLQGLGSMDCSNLFDVHGGDASWPTELTRLRAQAYDQGSNDENNEPRYSGF